MVAYLFAGQGSQYIGMGRDLCESFASAKNIFDRADKILDFSLSRLCFEGPKEQLIKTENCQPAILTVSIAALEAAKEIGKDKLLPANYMAGLSLGEYSALVAGGALTFEEAVHLVRRRGQFMEEEARKKPGKMLSIIGLDLEVVRAICSETNTEVANINSPGQVVISGGPLKIEEAKALSQDRKVKLAIELDVSGAFHSSFMKGAATALAKEIDKINFKMPHTPVISNVTAKPFGSVQEIKDNLIKQVYSSVLWEDSMRFILKQGVANFIEFGPGKVLKGLMRRIDANAQVVNMEKKDDVLGLANT